MIEATWCGTPIFELPDEELDEAIKGWSETRHLVPDALEAYAMLVAERRRRDREIAFIERDIELREEQERRERERAAFYEHAGSF